MAKRPTIDPKADLAAQAADMNITDPIAPPPADPPPAAPAPAAAAAAPPPADPPAPAKTLGIAGALGSGGTLGTVGAPGPATAPLAVPHTPTTLAGVVMDALPSSLVSAVPTNITQWAIGEGVAMATNLLDIAPDAATVAAMQQGLASLAMTALTIVGNKDAKLVNQAKQQRSIILSEFDDLEAVAAGVAAATARKSVAKLLTDAADFALSGAIKVGL